MLGILTGISYVSGIDYYKGINERVTAEREKGFLMPPNPDMMMISVDCDVYVYNLTQKSFAHVADYLLQGVSRLVDAGCDWLVIASNTGHICVPAVEAAYPDLKVLHIADCAAYQLEQLGLTQVGLVGTKPTMEEDYLKDRLRRHGIETMVPAQEATRDEIYRIIYEELSFNQFPEPSRDYMVGVIRELAQNGAEACISGCTEIELLVQQEHLPLLPWIPTAELHIQTVADVILGKMSLDDILP